MQVLITWILVSIFRLSLFQTSELRVRIQHTDSDKGKILILVFNQPDGFPDQVDKAFKKYALPPKNKGLDLVISDLAPGNYAFTVLHDEDGDEKMKTSFLGIPAEKYGFSNNPKIYFTPPSFEKAAVKLGAETKSIVIDLR